ncbi:hypothetical protein BH09ACT12_BH09ACT12_31530 [soil metagenome]
MAPVVHLSGAVEAPPKPLPVVTRLSLAELILLADRAGNPRLPLDLDGHADDDATDRLQDRLSGGRPSVGQRAHGLVRAAQDEARTAPEPLAARLAGIGLLDADGTPVGDVVAALGMLATPEAMLVLDLAVRRVAGEARLRSFFAVAGSRVAQLSTVSGLSYELAWYDVGGLPDALTRAATIEDDDAADHPTDDPTDGFGPEVVELPLEVFTDGTEAVRRSRDDLLAEVIRIAQGPVRVGGDELTPADALALVTSLENDSRGRLRVLVTVPQDGAERRVVGVVSWLHTRTGWRWLSPDRVGGVPTVRIVPVDAGELARVVAPVLAQVVR